MIPNWKAVYKFILFDLWNILTTSSPVAVLYVTAPLTSTWHRARRSWRGTAAGCWCGRPVSKQLPLPIDWSWLPWIWWKMVGCRAPAYEQLQDWGSLWPADLGHWRPITETHRGHEEVVLTWGGDVFMNLWLIICSPGSLCWPEPCTWLGKVSAGGQSPSDQTQFCWGCASTGRSLPPEEGRPLGCTPPPGHQTSPQTPGPDSEQVKKIYIYILLWKV